MNSKVEPTPPHDLDPKRLPQPADIRDVADIIRFHARHRPAHHASRFEGRTTTYAELDQRSSRIACALTAEGLGTGDRVAYLGYNSDEYFELFFGCAKAGVVLTAVSHELEPEEISHIVRDAEARLLFVGPELAGFVKPVARLRRIVSLGTGNTGWLNFSEWYAKHPADDPQRVIAPSAPLLQLYTSGTTGQPKGVPLTHGNLLAAGFQLPDQPWARWRLDDVSLLAMPVSHIAGSAWGYLGYRFGALNLLVRKFTAREALELIEKEHVTRLFAVPAAMQAMLRVPSVRKLDLGRLEYLVYGAAPISLALLREALEVFRCGFCQWYGLTETTGPITYLSPEDHATGSASLLGAAGKPPAHVELRIRRHDGRIARENQSGDIETRSALNMPGYWRLPHTTRSAFTDDGWLRTGDAGYLDEQGYLYVHDRVTDSNG